MWPVLPKRKNNILEKLFALLRYPRIISLKNRYAILFFIWLNVVIQHPSTVNFHLLNTSCIASFYSAGELPNGRYPFATNISLTS